MNAKTSKVVTDRQKACHFLITALLNQGPRISDLLLEQMRPELQEGDDEPATHTLHVGMARALGANMTATVAADEAMYRVNARLEDLREERKEAGRRVAQEIMLVRKILVGQYRAPRLKHLGVGTRTAATPGMLLRQADRTVVAFTGEEFETLLGEPFHADQLPPRDDVAALGAAAETLRSVLQEINAMVRARDEAFVAKKRHLAEHDQLYVSTARTFEDICRLAGERDLAERVRRSARRRRVAEPLEGQEPEEATEPSEGEEPPPVPSTPEPETPALS